MTAWIIWAVSLAAVSAGLSYAWWRRVRERLLTVRLQTLANRLREKVSDDDPATAAVLENIAAVASAPKLWHYPSLAEFARRLSIVKAPSDDWPRHADAAAEADLDAARKQTAEITMTYLFRHRVSGLVFHTVVRTVPRLLSLSKNEVRWFLESPDAATLVPSWHAER